MTLYSHVVRRVATSGHVWEGELHRQETRGVMYLSMLQQHVQCSSVQLVAHEPLVWGRVGLKKFTMPISSEVEEGIKGIILR